MNVDTEVVVVVLWLRSFLFILTLTSSLISTSRASEFIDDPTLVRLVQNFIQASKQEDINEKELKRREVETYFQQNFFKEEFRKNMAEFPHEKYIHSLNYIQSLVESDPVAMSELAFAIQTKWQRTFLDLFTREYERVEGGKRNNIRMAIQLANLASDIYFLGPAIKESFQNMGKKLFSLFKTPKATETVEKVVKTQINLGKELGLATIPAVGAGSVATIVENNSEENSSSIPVPPAQIITLAEEPEKQQIDEIENKELLLDAVSTVGVNGTGIFINWALTSGRALQWIGRLVKAARIPITVAGGVGGEGVGAVPAFLITVVSGFILEEGIQEAMDFGHEYQYESSLEEALSKYKDAETSGNNYDKIRAGLDLSRAARQLSAFYRAEIFRGQREENPTENLNRIILLYLKQTCVDKNGNLIPDALNAHLNLWKKNADRAKIETERREADTMLKKISEFASATVSKVTCTECGPEEKISPSPAELKQQEEKKLLEEIQDEAFLKASSIYTIASQYINDFKKIETQESFGSFIDKTLLKEQQKDAQALGEGQLAQNTDGILLQTASWIRLHSTNEQVLKDLADELEYSVANFSKEPLLSTPLGSKLFSEI